MSMTISTRLEHKSQSKARGMRHHCERSSKVLPVYVDQSRTHLNSIIIEVTGEAQLRKECESLRATQEHKRAMKIDAAVLTDGIITFGTEAQKVIESMTKEKQDELFLATAKKLSEFCGSKLVSLTVHRDEQAIHAHYGMLAVGNDGKPLSKTLNPNRMSMMQDIAANTWLEYGITRGESKVARIARGDDASKVYHRSVKQLHQDLPVELEQKQKELDVLIEAKAIEANRKKEVEAAKRNEIKRLVEIKKAITEQESVKETLDASVAASKEKLEKNQRLLDATLEKMLLENANIDVLQKRADTYTKRIADAESKIANMRQYKKAQPMIEKIAHIAEKTPTALNHFLREYDAKQEPLKAAESILNSQSIVRYDVIVNVATVPDARVTIPNQEAASDAQKAAALYRSAMEFLDTTQLILFTVTSDTMAKKINAMARADNIKFEVHVNGMPYQAPTMQPGGWGR